MARLRVLSWNIRTFGTHAPGASVVRRIAALILESQADIVCIQELMIGNGVVGEVGAPIAQDAFDAVGALYEQLNELDSGGGWWWAVSGVNSGISDHMRDAYAFLFKETPAKSSYAHADAPDAITDLGDPVILRQPGADYFPGRRPGMFTVNVRAGGTVTMANIVSYHARTPVNRFSKGQGSGYGIDALATLPEVGGGKWLGTGRSWTYRSSVTALPQVDTLVLGDFNYSMDFNGAADTYKNLLVNYEACISTPDHFQYTTYAPDGKQALRLISAYDNIFVLQKHGDFVPALSFEKGGVIDFIKAEAKQLGDAIGFTTAGIGTTAAWYVIHQDLYKKQHAVEGLSDHLPVWADFAIKGTATTASQVLSTSGADNNCLFHAMFGALDGGSYVDTTAASRRNALVLQLKQYQANRAFAGSPRIRASILSAMINEFDGNPGALNGLQVLLANIANPFDEAGFSELYTRYISFIANGRMLYVHEAELVAVLDNRTVVLHYVDRGRYADLTLNGGQPSTVHIFHQALHFSRWQA
jgi:endonuclease/exonuclease/phosphatase family metal-dependent hydrolase